MDSNLLTFFCVAACLPQERASMSSQSDQHRDSCSRRATLRYRTGCRSTRCLSSRSVLFSSPEQQSVTHVRSLFTLKFPARAPVLLVVLGTADITAREVTFGHRRCAIRTDRGQTTRRSSHLDVSIGAPDKNAALTSIRPSKKC